MASQSRLSIVEEFVESEDGRKLLLRSWRPGRVRAVMAIVHEPGSDGAKYRSFAETLAANGLAGYAIDLRGRDRSRDPRARFLPVHLLDVQAMMSRIRSRDPMTPVFILGHGAGALIACLHALGHEDELDGVICEGILLSEPWKSTISRVAHRLVRSLFRLPGSGRFDFRKFRNGALRELSLPLLLLHGSDDRIAAPSGSEYVHRLVSSKDKTLQVFEGCDHELVNAPDHALVRDKICQWIEAQLDSASTRRRIGVEYINE